jgi:geranylgeranyl pyrophosphate synthase
LEKARKFSEIKKILFLQNLVGDTLQSFLNKITEEETFKASLKYILGTGGKRLRPVLMLGIIEDLNGSLCDYLNASLSVEMLHLSSLIHDDLPSLDNDNFRRGFPTIHIQFSESTAVLLGDWLIAKAFENLIEYWPNKNSTTKAIKIISKRFQEVCSGQNLDCNLIISSLEVKEKINRLKTSSLFLLPLELAGLSRNILDTESYFITRLGEQLGLYFQALDDLKDSIDQDNQDSFKVDNVVLIQRIEELYESIDILLISKHELSPTYFANTRAILEYIS